MIKNILDKYFLNNLIRCIKSWCVVHRIETMFIQKQGKLRIYFKDNNHNHFEQVLSIRKEDAILYLSNLCETKREFIEIIKQYQKRK